MTRILQMPVDLFYAEPSRGFFWDFLGRLGAVGGGLGRFGTVWDGLGRFGTFWDGFWDGIDMEDALKAQQGRHFIKRGL
jgi:hypothetical protein